MTGASITITLQVSSAIDIVAWSVVKTLMLELGDNSTRRLTDTDTLQSELSNYPNTKKK